MRKHLRRKDDLIHVAPAVSHFSQGRLRLLRCPSSERSELAFVSRLLQGATCSQIRVLGFAYAGGSSGRHCGGGKEFSSSGLHETPASSTAERREPERTLRTTEHTE
jgi:hypothetical protein